LVLRGEHTLSPVVGMVVPMALHGEVQAPVCEERSAREGAFG
jgi:hypothetical protein